ncbi:hypothetical protein N825_01175 [Skermanella stibiiresistens SB22]|uniref:Glycosyltransferase RgtA/B/C/D-like domain-containing protein n=1 Tax=Skermanella stibiiresistens SB22 TaxID=1385369 RepID=W9HA32_9PROT|nr:hypothetical protein [Skermanella stibiiresistens]EWY42829.1 hypothetical protein N825_01175 [Skermanella stibiiresistens SB22]
MPFLLLRPAVVAFLAFAVSVTMMALFLGGEARGRMEWHVMPAQAWGVPAELAARGIVPLYHRDGEVGWDGQFYYYMSNDLLATTDASLHIDTPPYRYQRVGLSLTAYALSILTIQDWVSPFTYYLANLLLVVTATYVLAAFLVGRRLPVWPALLWSLSAGVQVTLLNGLPDAAADAYMIMAIVAFLSGRWLLYGLAISMAALSREIYVSVAFVLFVHFVMSTGTVTGWRVWLKANWEKFLFLALPGAVFIFWQAYVTNRFGIAPHKAAGTVLAPPLEQAWFMLRTALSGEHPMYGTSYREAAGIVFFLGILFAYAVTAIRMIARRTGGAASPLFAVVIAFIPATLLYLCFDEVVMKHYSGYMKPASIFLVLIPLLFLLTQNKMPAFMSMFLIASIALSMNIFLRDRILHGPSTLAENSIYSAAQTVPAQAACLPSPADYQSSLKLIGIESFHGQDIFRRIAGNPRVMTLILDVTNRSTHALPVSQGLGSVRLSYHWLSKDGSTVVRDGLRSVLQTALEPGETRTLKINVEFTEGSPDAILRLSLVQEGCAWFYLAGDPGFIDIKFLRFQGLSDKHQVAALPQANQ